MPPIPPPEPALLREAAARALGEDRGPADDITSHAFIPADARASARIFVKEAAVLAGLVVAERVFQEEDPALLVTVEKADGDRLAPGDTVLRVSGPLRSLLGAERAALNFLQHLSGIATVTARYVAAAAGTRAAILDTRKTTPGLRHLEKYAVRCGGGMNHRFGLYDHFLVKDNHLATLAPEALPAAIAEARRLAPGALVEFEADTLEQVARFAALGVDRLLLDNMTTAQMAEAVALVAGRCQLEASGNMTLERIAAVAATGVDFISVGALTHSAPAIDFSLEVLP
jgi:nicotinate-nucleotide pyrophosphorylase (carboxylating)